MAEENNSQNPLEFLKGFKKNILLFIILILGGVIAFTSFFTVQPEEVGVVIKLGKFSRTVEPGLNFKLPFIETVYKVPVERQQKLEFGFRTRNADVKSEFETRPDESLMLTGDLNLANVEWVVQYRIDVPYNFLFKVRNPEMTLRDLSEACMRQVVGDYTVTEVITERRTEIAIKLKKLLHDLANDYSLGITVEEVVLQDVNPPSQVRDAFNAENEAQQQKETLINQAKSEYNKVVPKAKGQAEETIQKAEGYATKRINNAKGEVARFNELYSEYIKAPDVTKSRIYLETMSRILPLLGNKIITDDKGSNVLPLLQMQMQNQKGQ